MPDLSRYIFLLATLSATYDHRLQNTGHPVRSATHKLQIGGLVVGSVTTSEYPLLYVFVSFLLCPTNLPSPDFLPSIPYHFILTAIANWECNITGPPSRSNNAHLRILLQNASVRILYLPRYRSRYRRYGR